MVKVVTGVVNLGKAVQAASDNGATSISAKTEEDGTWTVEEEE